jgi:hypothetical protein
MPRIAVGEDLRLNPHRNRVAGWDLERRRSGSPRGCGMNRWAPPRVIGARLTCVIFTLYGLRFINSKRMTGSGSPPGDTSSIRRSVTFTLVCQVRNELKTLKARARVAMIAA